MNLLVKPKYITLTLHGLIWGAVLALPLFVGSADDTFPAAFSLVANIIHLVLFYFNAYYLYPKLMNRRRWWLYIICVIALIGGSFRLKMLVLNVWFPELTIYGYMNAFLGFPIIFFLVISTIYRIILNRINYEKRLKEREAEQLSTELKFLRSQISPHFLFNVLNNLVSMARHQSNQLEPSLIRLAGLMRYMLYESDGKKVPLTKEIDYLKSYIELQKIRFEEDVAISTDIRYEDGPDTIEPMLLIPFVENAFKHGVALVDHPFISIRLQVMAHTLHFYVDNKFSTEIEQSKDKDSGIGLANVKTRLQLLYPGQHLLMVDDHDEVFRIHLTLPLT